MMWVMSVANKASSRLKYLNDIMQTIEPPSRLTQFRRGLRRIKAREPLDQAPPMSRQALMSLLPQLPPAQSAALYIARRAACRLDEITTLTGKKILQADVQLGIIIWWAADVKTAHDDPFRPETFVVIAPPHPSTNEEPNLWPAVVNFLRRLPPKAFLCRDKTVLVNALKTVDPCFSGHSIKSGAVTDLMVLAATNVLCPAAISAIPLVAKHRTVVPVFPASTVRYCRDKTAVAMALGTHNVTKYL